MINPVGSSELQPLFVYDPETHHKLSHEAESLPSVVISSQAAGNAVMMGAGYFNPLKGYMTVADAMGAAEKMTLTDGSFFPVPVLCLLENTDAIGDAKRIALRDPNMEGNPVLAVMDIENIEEVSDEQMAIMTDKVYRTDDSDHPGVAAFNGQGRVAISGPIQVLSFSYFQADFPDTFRTAVEIRNEIQERGWSKIVAFQTRNPMHLAHEELCHMAMDRLGCDGLVIHMLLGKLKPGDIPAPVRDAAIRKMVELYFPPNSAMVTGYGFDMLYAGPREAVLHAYFRQNMGATHFIIGRDHAGVGDYYGAFDAQTIFEDEVPAGALEIEIFKADHTAWSKKLDKVVMMCEAPDHEKEDFVLLSGTKVREMLGQGIAPPKEFSRPEVAQILIDYYQSIN
ncbi:MAG: sulfate adenylyltransferase [Candidatus Thiodiazotropha sp. (ex Lucina aurantia)]|uniref:Sulfate adenylyltransferase n=2 Tax=Candidatus Thiodiazotropha TaxID=1913444 RepID=A0A7Z0VP03_9GAMM|nr:sulfate adenylyltransferase [Candidatus Thiodiazotropha endolucinida]MBT3011352.1 sulfate adenylyltransferase [Candidatus Thiodiazotropha sp. (ex Lucina pensylvanica)]MBT3015078.1 sulfate adenylyltransferase [Candidatus Thiodiazotropha taylori]MBT3038309.1 sulfate adenylyltransferase [Candidatus Thiodiazotropha sp. (ex Codakia orbicularis)]MBV2102995.1 sulfate adenylyltransferase [Candidatus Thiodiazotropha sp. (ex Lucina aurantia)]MBT3023218.1 sulfate adenylyltransferase [Candidatus Thiodi